MTVYILLFTGILKRKGIFEREIHEKRETETQRQSKRERGTYIVEQIVSRGTYLQNFQ